MSDLGAVMDGVCVCDSRYDGCIHPNPCGAPNDGTGRGPWCADCDPRRIAVIDVALRKLQKDLSR